MYYLLIRQNKGQADLFTRSDPSWDLVVYLTFNLDIPIIDPIPVEDIYRHS